MNSPVTTSQPALPQLNTVLPQPPTTAPQSNPKNQSTSISPTIPPVTHEDIDYRIDVDVDDNEQETFSLESTEKSNQEKSYLSMSQDSYGGEKVLGTKDGITDEALLATTKDYLDHRYLDKKTLETMAVSSFKHNGQTKPLTKAVRVEQARYVQSVIDRTQDEERMIKQVLILASKNSKIDPNAIDNGRLDPKFLLEKLSQDTLVDVDTQITRQTFQSFLDAIQCYSGEERSEVRQACVQHTMDQLPPDMQEVPLNVALVYPRFKILLMYREDPMWEESKKDLSTYLMRLISRLTKVTDGKITILDEAALAREKAEKINDIKETTINFASKHHQFKRLKDGISKYTNWLDEAETRLSELKSLKKDFVSTYTQETFNEFKERLESEVGKVEKILEYNKLGKKRRSRRSPQLEQAAKKVMMQQTFINRLKTGLNRSN